MTFVVDHAAKPRIADGGWDRAWEAALAPLAKLPNVTCKISGLVTGADWRSWTRDQLRPYVGRVLDWFGPTRCMFGSDWPVCLVAADYAEVFATTRAIVGDDAEVFGGTASRVYRLAERT
jgi:L-fuconolactonase